MTYILQNEELKVTISSLGAEVTSIIDQRSGNELIWHGDPRYWAGHGPVLFPACGGLWDGHYTLGDRQYDMPKHGLVRRSEWQLVDIDDDSQHPSWVVLRTDSDQQTRQHYPFDYALMLNYELNGRQLTCQYIVSNNSTDAVMPFQIGGHPSVALPDFSPQATEPIGYLQPLSHHGTSVDAHCLSVVRVGQQGCWQSPRYPAPAQPDGLIPITSDTFAHEALIFDRNQLSGFRVLDRQRLPLCTVRSDAPVFLVWQPQGLLSPFVCVEPWYGLCDHEGQSTPLIERPYSQCALPQDERWGELYTLQF